MFQKKEFIWDHNEKIWESENARFKVLRFIPMPNNYLFVDMEHDQYIIYLAQGNDDAKSVAERLSSILNGR